MSDDLSYTPSSQNGLNDDWESDASTVSSDWSELSAAKLATHPEHAVIWELLQGCQEAAAEDIPDRHHECMSIFDTRYCNPEPVVCQNYTNESEYYDDVFCITGATKSSEPWSLPCAARSISDEDALWPPNMQVMNVAQVTPTAAVYLTPGTALAEQFQHMVDAAIPSQTTEDIANTLKSASPLFQTQTPLFASAAMTSASQIAHRAEKPSFHTLRKYNRLATTSLLRQVHSFRIDVPVVGVLLQGSLVTFHVDWYEERDGILDINSAFYTPNGEGADLKTWDMRDPIEGTKLKLILSNLRKYTDGPYATRILEGLIVANGQIQPWKWDPSLLPEVSAYTRLQQHIEEPHEEKIIRWQESMETTAEDAIRTAWLRQNLLLHKKQPKTAHRDQQRLHDFLSPPSTPQSPEKQ